MQRENLKFDKNMNDILNEGYSGNPETECLRNFHERIRNIAPFACLVRRLGNLQKYPHYDIFSLGIGALLFVLENMLIGREECTIDEVSDFLRNLIYKIYKDNLPVEDSKELAFYIRDAITGNGEVYQFEYMDLERGSTFVVPVKLMDVSFYEIKKTSRYKLTEQGMELLFKTREIYSEFRLNVTQLYLRQQIEKGVFAGAIQTVNELNLQVRQLRERIEGIMQGIRQNVLGVDFGEMKSLLERIQEQFNMERKEFENIKYILGEQRRNLEEIDMERLTEKDLGVLGQIRVITEKIGMVSREHDRLFNEKLDILGEYLKMLEFRMKAGLTDYLDYEGSIFDVVGSKNLPFEALGRMLSPLFLNRSKNKSFNIMKALDPQKIRADEQEEDTVTVNYEELLELREKEQREKAEKRNKKIEVYIEMILKAVEKHGETSIKAIIEAFDSDMRDMASKDFDFYSLIIMLHQRKQIDLEDIEGVGQSLVYDTTFNIDLEFLISRVLEENSELKKIKRLEIISSNKMYSFENGNTLTDFTIVRLD